MTAAHPDPANLPEYMTWEGLECLPEEIAGEIELWEGRVVWVRRGPAEHQIYTNLFWSALRRQVRSEMDRTPGDCWQVATETNIFFGAAGKSDFMTPDFLVYRCLPERFSDVRAADVILVGEVLSPSNAPADMDAKKARYAQAGIPWYWDVKLDRGAGGISLVRIFALETGTAQLPQGVRPMYRANYLAVGEWSPNTDPGGITIAFPFPIRIPWSDLDI